MLEFFTFLFIFYCGVVYLSISMRSIADFDRISTKAWARPFIHFYLWLLGYIFAPVIVPIKSIYYLIKNFKCKVTEAKEQMERDETKKLISHYRFEPYMFIVNKQYSINQYLRFTLIKHGDHPDIKLLKDYLLKNKTKDTVITVEDLKTFHKYGKY